MVKVIHSFLVLLLVLCVLAPVAPAQDAVEEPSTGQMFPRMVTFESGGGAYHLTVTGLAVRKKFMFKVYGMAHYMDIADFDSKEAAFEAVKSDEHAKQITMVFVRDVEAKKIQDAYREGFRKNASDEEFEEIADLVERFAGFYTTDITKGDRYVIRWLPGGVVESLIHGIPNETITETTFASVLWRIWLGEHSIVDRDRLVEMAVDDDD
jgi:hypothetical protein